jgi:hypothetical protein
MNGARKKMESPRRPGVHHTEPKRSIPSLKVLGVHISPREFHRGRTGDIRIGGREATHPIIAAWLSKVVNFDSDHITVFDQRL